MQQHPKLPKIPDVEFFGQQHCCGQLMWASTWPGADVHLCSDGAGGLRVWWMRLKLIQQVRVSTMAGVWDMRDQGCVAKHGSQRQ